MEVVVLRVREQKPPALAMLVPLLYLLACAAAVKAVSLDPTADVGVPSLLAAVGLLPAFALPGVFSTREVVLSTSESGLLVDGRVTKLDDLRLEQGERGSALLHVETRAGETRTFHVASHKDAQRLVAQIPPVSAPAGALAA